MDLPEHEAREATTMAIRALNEASDGQEAATLLAYAQVRAIVAVAAAIDRLAQAAENLQAAR